MALLEIIKAKLTTDGVVTSAWPCYIGYAPDDTDQVIVLTHTGGLEQETHEGETIRPTFQVRVRAGVLAYATCETKWWAMFDSLHDANLVASGIYLIQAVATGPLPFLDEKNRHNMTANFRAVQQTP